MVKNVFAVVLLLMVSTALAADNAAPAPPKFPGFPGLPHLPFPGRRAIPPLPHLPFPGNRAIPPLPHFPFPGHRAIPPLPHFPFPGHRAIPPLPHLPFPGHRAIPPLPHLPFPGHRAIPPLPHFPFPGHRASPPPPSSPSPPSGQMNPQSLPKPDPKFDKCFQDFNIGQGCVQQIMTSFFSHKLNVDAACCQNIQKVVDDCVSAVFGQFNNPFFGPLLKQFCSSGSGPSPPSA